jgi:ribosome-associated protein
MQPLRVNTRLVLPAHELHVSFAHSGGPGGQNVNKVATKAVLRFSVRASQTLGDTRRARIMERLRSRLTKEGELVIHASRYRERARNVEDARERLATSLQAALLVAKRRIGTKPTRSSKRRRLTNKRQRSQTKNLRRNTDE